MPANSPVEVIPDNFAKVVHKLVQLADPEPQTVSYGVGLTASDLPGIVAARDACATAFADEIMPIMSDAWTLQSTILRGSPVDGPFVVEGGVVQQGTIVGEALPSNTALLVEKSTALAGRGNRGRMFLPGALQDDDVDSRGVIEAGPYGTRVTAVGDFLVALTGAAAITDMVLLHADFIRNPAVAHDDTDNPAYMIANPSADTPTPVLSLLVDPICATQRRRMR